MIGASLQRFAMVLALVGGLGELAVGSGGLLLALGLPVGVLGVSLELYQSHRLERLSVDSLFNTVGIRIQKSSSKLSSTDKDLLVVLRTG